jgi:ABC-2 type transport system ATP-binding protein/lipopolysaccharide transport system ATP-binding protein
LDKSIKVTSVSKRYRLGLTRTSLTTLISEWVRKPFNKDKIDDSRSRTLWALRDISFELGRGQSLALIGPNGAGKTTILKVLSNITRPTSGQIEINGRLSALIELGAGFHPDLTGRENIYLNGTILGLNKREIERRFDEIVDFSDLEGFIDTPVKRYSSGMSVRLGFSVAACIEPDVLLVDEVLAVGDASFRQKCINRIHELLDKGVSIVFVSHNLWLVQSVCKNALYIDHGRIKHYGKTSKVIELYDRDLSEQRAANFEISDQDHIGSSRDVEITNIEITGTDGLVNDEFSNDQSVDIQVHYFAHKDIGEVNFVIRVIRSDGLTCCMLRTKLDNIDIRLQRGEGILSVIMEPIQLYGGTYYIDARIRDASDIDTLAHKSSDWIYVKGSILSSGSMNGVFEPNRQWKFHQSHLVA